MIEYTNTVNSFADLRNLFNTKIINNEDHTLVRFITLRGKSGNSVELRDMNNETLTGIISESITNNEAVELQKINLMNFSVGRRTELSVSYDPLKEYPLTINKIYYPS